MSSEAECDSKTERYLQNWEKWLEERERVAKKVGRPPGEMVMNIGEEIRGIREDQLVLQYTRIPTHFDKLRGNPAFFEFPPQLKDKSLCGDGPDLWAFWTKEKQNIIPAIDYVGVPDYIKWEKNIIPRTRNLYTLWQKSEYRRKKVRALRSKILRVQPHKPQIDNLIIIGRGFGQDDEDEVETPPLPKDGSDGSRQILLPTVPESTEPGAFEGIQINGILLTQRAMNRGSTRFRLSFSQDISVKHPTPSKKNLVLTNMNQVVLKITWKKKQKFRLMREYVDEKFDKYGFFFNKNELWLMPDERVEFPVWFFSDQIGVYNEMWEMETVPEMWPDYFHVYLALHGDTYSQKLQDKIVTIMEMIENKARDALIKEILDSLTLKIRYEDNPKRPCEIEAEQEFETKNMVRGRIRYLFNQVIVEKQLKELFDKVNVDDVEEHWNYSLKKLQLLAKNKDFIDYFNNKETKLLELKKIVDEETKKRKAGEAAKGDKKDKKKKKGGDKKSGKSKTSKSSSKSSKKSKKGKKEKKNAEPVEVKIIKQWNEDYIFNSRHEYESSVTRLETVTIKNCQREKMFEAFKVFTMYFSKMCALLDQNHVDLEVRRICSYPQTFDTRIKDWEEEPERKVYEYFEQYDMPKPTHPEDEPQISGNPKPKILKKIPVEDSDVVFTTYFQKPIVPLTKRPKDDGDAKKKGKKGKKGKDKKSKSSKGSSKSKKSGKKSGKDKKGKKGKKDKKGKEIKPVESEEIVFFDPHSEEFHHKVDMDNLSRVGSIREGAFEIPQHYVDEHRLSSYVIVYGCLSEAVDALVDALTPFECLKCAGRE